MSDVVWGTLIGIYPFLSGMATGSLILAALIELLEWRKLRELTLFSLIISWALLIAAVTALFIHLGIPLRAFYIFIHPQLSSPMVYGVYSWLLLFILLTATIVIYNWYTDRPWFKTASRYLLLINMVLAIIFSSYSGFLFGSIKGVELWSSPLTPISFLTSAVLSGAAVVTLLYVVVWRLTKTSIKHEILNTLGVIILIVLIASLFIQVIELLVKAKISTASWPATYTALTSQLAVSFIGLQFLLGGVVPLVALLLGSVRKSDIGMLVIALLVLIGALAYKWNTVIGGQLVEEALSGVYAVTSYTPPLTGEDSILWAIGVLIWGVFLIALGLVVFPKWRVMGGTEGGARS